MWLSSVGGIVPLALSILAALLAAAPPSAHVPRLGVLSAGSPSTTHGPLDAFRRGLQNLGYREGQNIVLEYRYAEGKLDRLPDLAAELVRLQVDVIVTGGNEAVEAAKKTTQTIPIVMAFSGDPVAAGFVASLASPGGNITGLSRNHLALIAKRLELLKEAVPGVRRVAVLLYPEGRFPRLALQAAQAAAQELGLQLQVLEVRAVNDIDSAFRAAARERASALMVLPGGFLPSYRTRVVDLAAQGRLPGVYPDRAFVEAGGLMSYDTDMLDQYRRAAMFVDKILKGAKPSDLPVEQPMKYELVINLKTAKALDLMIPPSLLFQADQVIQ